MYIYIYIWSIYLCVVDRMHPGLPELLDPTLPCQRLCLQCRETWNEDVMAIPFPH